MRLGIFGGSFDPPHLGHMIFAEHARVSLALDRVLFVPAAVSPFKTQATGSDPAVRAELVALAVTGNPHFSVDAREIVRGGVSYTVDSLEELTVEYAGHSLVLLMGGDAFAEFPTWRDPERICRLATLGVGHREGLTLDFASHPFGAHAVLFDMPRIDVSARQIRDRVRTGRSITYLVPWTVQTFIQATGLYRM